jgi:hypothetical protein
MKIKCNNIRLEIGSFFSPVLFTTLVVSQGVRWFNVLRIVLMPGMFVVQILLIDISFFLSFDLKTKRGYIKCEEPCTEAFRD